VSEIVVYGLRAYTGLGSATIAPPPAWGAARAAKDGVAFKNTPYPDGEPGVRISLTEMARLMREARNDKDVCGYAADVLKAAGLDGRNRDTWTARNIAQAFLDNVRAVTIYTPDPAGTEMIVSPAGMLCLRPGLCIRKEDCDGQTTLLGALCMSVGLEVRILKQSWGADQQQHVLLAVRDESGNWLKADPSHASLPVGRGVPAHEEQQFDPLGQIGAIGTAGAELVTFGALPSQQARSLTVRPPQINAQLTPRGFGAPAPATTAYAQSNTDLTAMTNSVSAADTYLAAGEYSNAVTAYQAAGDSGAQVIGPEIDLAGAPNVTQPITQQAWQINGQLALIPATGATQASATQAQTYAKQMLALYQQAITAGNGAASSNTPGGGPSGGPQTSTGTATAIVIGGGLLAGLALEFLVFRPKRSAKGTRR
jgi:hypothetical protein